MSQCKKTVALCVCILCALMSVLSTGKGFAADSRLYFNRITTDSGLSHNTVNCIIQDSKGFLWIGTPDGINRYDGANFETFYRNDLGVSCSFITSVCEDARGNIWVGTDCGVTVYDAAADRFRRIDDFCASDVTINNNVPMIKRHGNLIWIAVDNQGLFSYDTATGRLDNYFVENGVHTLPANIACFYFDANNTCWLSLPFDNLYRAAGDFSSIEPYTLADGTQPFLRDNVTRMIQGLYNSIYVGSVNRGVTEIKLSSNSINGILPSGGKDLLVNDIFLENSDYLWITTTNGLVRFDMKTAETLFSNYIPDDAFSLSDNETTSILIDDQEGLWVGTYNGLNHQNNNYLEFHKYYRTDGVSLEGQLVRGFADDGNGTMWIATKNAGLFRYEQASGSLRHYENERLPDNLYGICYDKGFLWLTSHSGGICRLNTFTGRIKHFHSNGYDQPSLRYKTYRIYKNSLDELYVGTSLGLLKYDAVMDDFETEPRFDGKFVYDILEDSKGNMWYATYDHGLYKSDIESDSLINYRHDPLLAGSIPSNKILSVFEDGKGCIWIATHGAGAVRFDAQQNRFVAFDFFDRESTNIAYRIVEDDTGVLWITTNKGLVRMNPDSGKYRIYTTADGLLNNEFDYSSGIRQRNGDIFLGSKDGFIRFNPRNFKANKKVPNIVITDFFVDGRLVKPGDTGSPLNETVANTTRISLSARENNIGFRISILNLHSPANNVLYYRMLGYNDEWQKASSHNTVSFSNLPAGRYMLEVKGVSSDEVWNHDHPPIEIIVAQKGYKSTAAIILYVMLFVVISALVFYYFYSKAMNRERKRQEEYERNKNIEHFNDKMAFFSNIIHEIKTPLTLIRTPLQNILSTGECDGDTREDLMVISNNTEYLSQLVRELLDFVKIEARGYVLEYRNIDIVEKIGFLCSNFSETAKNNNIRLTFRHTQDQIFINADEKGLIKILNNLLHNAIKYAETRIDVEASLVGDNVVVSFQNDGPVIPQHYRNEIFKPFVQYNNDIKPYTTGVGIGLSLARNLAELHSGSLVIDDDMNITNFILTIPAGCREENTAQTVAETEPAEDLLSDRPNLPHLLIVEDNADLAAYLKRKMESDYRVTTSPTAEKALELILHHQFDIIVSDIALGGMSGLELCRKICSDFETSHIPVIMLSALSSLKAKVEAMEYGAALYVEKPFNMEYLQAYVKNILEKRRGLKSAYKGKSMLLAPHLYNLTRTDEEFLIQLDSIIQANLTDPNFSNEQLAEALFLSKSTLNRKMKGLLDTTPNDYIRTRRLVIAAQLLAENKCRINEVCYSVGFNTPSYFAKCFKKHYGILPAEYMKEHNVDNK